MRFIQSIAIANDDHILAVADKMNFAARHSATPVTNGFSVSDLNLPTIIEFNAKGRGQEWTQGQSRIFALMDNDIGIPTQSTVINRTYFRAGILSDFAFDIKVSALSGSVSITLLVNSVPTAITALASGSSSSFHTATSSETVVLADEDYAAYQITAVSGIQGGIIYFPRITFTPF